MVARWIAMGTQPTHCFIYEMTTRCDLREDRDLFPVTSSNTPTGKELRRKGRNGRMVARGGGRKRKSSIDLDTACGPLFARIQ